MSDCTHEYIVYPQPGWMTTTGHCIKCGFSPKKPKIPSDGRFIKGAFAGAMTSALLSIPFWALVYWMGCFD